jgi:hypothetical protein
VVDEVQVVERELAAMLRGCPLNPVDSKIGFSVSYSMNGTCRDISLRQSPLHGWSVLFGQDILIFKYALIYFSVSQDGIRLPGQVE